MVLNVENKRVAQKKREMPRDDYAMIDAQKMTDVNDAANALQLMLDGKLGNLSVMARNGMSVDSTQFGYAAKDVWEVEDVVAKYNEISALFMSARRRDGAAAKHPETGTRAAAARWYHQERREQGAHKHHSDDRGQGRRKRRSEPDAVVLLRSVSGDARRLRHAVRAHQIIQAAAYHSERPGDAGLGPHQP